MSEDGREHEGGDERARGEGAREPIEPERREEAGEPLAKQQQQRDECGRIEGERQKIRHREGAGAADPARKREEELAGAPAEKPDPDGGPHGPMVEQAQRTHPAEDSGGGEKRPYGRVVLRLGDERSPRAGGRQDGERRDGGGDEDARGHDARRAAQLGPRLGDRLAAHGQNTARWKGSSLATGPLGRKE